MGRYPDVVVKTEWFPGADYFKKSNTLISSIEGNYRLAALGASQPLDDLVAASESDLGQFYPLNIEAVRLNGQLYGMRQLAHPGRAGLFYNVAMFDEAA